MRGLSTFRGEVVRPEDSGYDQARRVWNGMVDRRPAMIVRPDGVEDVAAAIRFGREEDCPSPCAAAGTASPGSPPATTGS